MLKVLLVAVSLAYPALVYFTIEHLGAVWFLPVMFALLLWRILASRHAAERAVLLLALAVLVVLVFALPPTLTLKFYPVLMSLAMLTLFGSSLLQDQSMVERLARLKEPDLPEAGVRYTRRVTWVWSCFFATNAVVSLATVFMNDQIWVLYNGVIAYLLIAALMAGEWLVRGRVKAGRGV